MILADFVPPEEVTEMTGYNHPPCVNPLIDEDDNSNAMEGAIDLLPQSREHKEFYTIDPSDDFEDLNLIIQNQQQSAAPSGKHKSN